MCFVTYHKCLCFLPQKKQRTKDLSRVFQSYSPYDHKVRGTVGGGHSRKVFLNVWHNLSGCIVVL